MCSEEEVSTIVLPATLCADSQFDRFCRQFSGFCVGQFLSCSEWHLSSQLSLQFLYVTVENMEPEG